MYSNIKSVFNLVYFQKYHEVNGCTPISNLCFNRLYLQRYHEVNGCTEKITFLFLILH